MDRGAWWARGHGAAKSQIQLSDFHFLSWASQVAQLVKKPPANAGDTRDVGLIPGSGRSPRVGNGNPVQFSCLENPWTEDPGVL